MDTVVLCLYSEGECCSEDCPIFKKCWGESNENSPH